MGKYHVGIGISDTIYAGVLKSNDEWKEKSDVTQEATAAVAQRLLEQRKCFHFKYFDQEYELKVQEVLPETDELVLSAGYGEHNEFARQPVKKPYTDND